MSSKLFLPKIMPTILPLGYALSKNENVIGSPERPLSDQGETLYYRFWMEKITDYVLRTKGKTPICKMSRDIFITEEDIAFTLEKMGLLKRKEGPEGTQLLEISISKLRTAAASVTKRFALFDPAHLKIAKSNSRKTSKQE